MAGFINKVSIKQLWILVCETVPGTGAIGFSAVDRATALFQNAIDLRKKLILLVWADVPQNIARNNIIKAAIREGKAGSPGLINLSVNFSRQLQQREHRINADHFPIVTKI